MAGVTPLVRRTHKSTGGALSLVVRTAIGIGLLAVIINDGGQLVTAQVKAESVARAAATAGADTYFRTQREDLAKQEAVRAAQDTDPATQVVSIEIDSRDGTVTVSVEKQAGTLLVQRIGFLKRYATQGATDSEVHTA
jgi:hypothetical protein